MSAHSASCLSRNGARRWWGAAAGVACAVAGMAYLVFDAGRIGTSWWAGSDGPQGRPVVAGNMPQTDVLPVSGRLVPLSIPPVVPAVVLPEDWSVVDKLTTRVWPRKADTLSSLAHALMTFEPDCAPPDAAAPTWSEIRSVLLDPGVNKSWYGGQVSLVETREGLRYIAPQTPMPAASAHVDQCLAVLGALGTRLDYPFRFDGRARPATLASVLQDCVANFHIDGEVEWTAMALCLYLPPQRAWRNKGGETCDFDHLAWELMSRPFASAPCRGTHGLYALSVMLRVDAISPILSSECRTDVTTYLRNCVAAVEQAQLASGAIPGPWFAEMVHEAWYWDIVERGENAFSAEIRKMGEWYTAPTSDGSAAGRAAQAGSDEQRGVDLRTLVQLTGHHLEWLMMLPPELHPGPEVFQRGAAFALTALREAGDEDLRRDFCPYSHLARVLRLLARHARTARQDHPAISGDDATGVQGSGFEACREAADDARPIERERPARVQRPESGQQAVLKLVSDR